MLSESRRRWADTNGMPSTRGCWWLSVMSLFCHMHGFDQGAESQGAKVHKRGLEACKILADLLGFGEGVPLGHFCPLSLQVGLKKYASVSPSAFGLGGRKRLAVIRAAGAIVGGAGSP